MNDIEKMIAEAVPLLQKLALKAIEDACDEDRRVLQEYHRWKEIYWRETHPKEAKAQDKLEARLAAHREELKLRKERG